VARVRARAKLRRVEEVRSLHDDYYLDRMLNKKDVRVKVYFIIWIASICASISLFIGGVYMVYLAMRYLGLF